MVWGPRGLLPPASSESSLLPNSEYSTQVHNLGTVDSLSYLPKFTDSPVRVYNPLIFSECRVWLPSLHHEKAIFKKLRMRSTSQPRTPLAVVHLLIPETHRPFPDKSWPVALPTQLQGALSPQSGPNLLLHIVALDKVVLCPFAQLDASDYPVRSSLKKSAQA